MRPSMALDAKSGPTIHSRITEKVTRYDYNLTIMKSQVSHSGH